MKLAMQIPAVPKLKLIEWAGSLTGLMGAYLVAQNADISAWAFPIWLLSNVFLLIFSYKTKAYGLMCMQVGFTYTSLTGISNYFNL